MEWLWSVAILVAVVPVLYMYTVSVVASRFPTVRNKRICLLIAHPDDEAMFFAPTVLALTRPETGNHVKILCLSSGDADGLGETRKRELVKSGMMLGLREESDIWVHDDPRFPDSMTQTWDADAISSLLVSAFAPHLARGSGSKPDDPPTAAVDVLVTFDSQGVSSHPNHVSLYHGARRFVATLMRGKTGWACPLDLYVLRSVPVARKYMGFLDVFATMLTQFGVDRRDKAHPASLVFASQLVGSAGWPTAWSAMTRAHQSQMLWFRYGWIIFSRYMVLNDLKLESFRHS